MTDVYDINFSDMSDELTSVIDTKYSTLGSIQKSLNSNLSQNSNLRPNSPEAIRARRLSRNSDVRNLQYAVVFNHLSLIFFVEKQFRSDIYKKTLQTEEFFEKRNTTDNPLKSGLYYKPFDIFSDIEKYIENKDIHKSEFKDRKAIEQVLFKLLEMAASTRMPSLQKVIDHANSATTEKDKRIKFDGTLKQNLIRHIKDWSEKREVAKLELLHPAFRERLINTIQNLTWIVTDEMQGIKTYSTTDSVNQIYHLNKSRSEATNEELLNLKNLTLEMRRFHPLIKGLDVDTLEQNIETEENTDRVFNAPQIFRTEKLKEDLIPFLFKEKKLILSEQHIYDVFSELLEDYTGTFRTISNITIEDDEEVDIFSTIQDINDISDFDALSLRREVVEKINSLKYEEKEILLHSSGFIELLSRIQAEFQRLNRGISSSSERKKFSILIKNDSRFLNFPPIKLGMTTNKLIKFLEKNLLQDFYNTDLSKDTLSVMREKILKNIFESYPVEEENNLELLVNDIFLEEFYKEFDVEIFEEEKDNEE
jgi:hypothetical protein